MSSVAASYTAITTSVATGQTTGQRSSEAPTYIRFPVSGLLNKFSVLENKLLSDE